MFKKRISYFFVLLFFSVLFFGCKKNDVSIVSENTKSNNIIKHANGFELFHFENYSILKITQPWPGNKTNHKYILHKKGVKIPDSLSEFIPIEVPIKNIIVTSTTHIPALEMLGTEKTLIGFPETNYISSPKTRKRIDLGFVENVGQNESLNVEKLIDLQPDVLIAFGITPQNPSIDLLQNNGQKVIYNGDWAEQSPLGKAEWIKLFGALYDKNQESEKIFQNIETEYYKAVELIKNTKNKPTILCGAIFQNIWYMPQGDSWAGNLMNEAKGNYLWKNTQGTGSLSLGFEEVFSKAQQADYWIDAAQFCSLKEMKESNIHYTEFKAFKNKKIYSSSLKKGAKGGIIFYEIAPTRPDLVLKDIIKIIHPECLPDYKLYFYQQLQ